MLKLILFQLNFLLSLILFVFNLISVKYTIVEPHTCYENAKLKQRKKILIEIFKLTFEYIRLSGKLIAIESNQTNAIFNVTRFLVLFRPKRIGYLNDKYLSIDIVHKCMILAVQNSTSRQIHTRQWIEWSGKKPVNEMFFVESE